MAVKPIALSFKNNENDIELYKWITSHSNMSGFIKDILRDKMNGNEIINKTNHSGKEKNNLITLDF